MKKSTYFFISILTVSALLYANDQSTSEASTPLIVKQIIKNNQNTVHQKNQPGISDIPKDKAYSAIVMEAQPHLKPNITHTPKQGASDEN